MSAPFATTAPVSRRRQFEATLARAAGRLAPYAELAKARIALMVLLAMGVGYLLGSRGAWNPVTFAHACLGVFLAVVSSSALNQYLERETDARMNRTKDRPLPTSRLTGREVLLFGAGCGVVSFAYLLFAVNALTAWLTLASTVTYAGLYTPLKRRTAFCTVIGAVPGAIPPVLGWTAAGGALGPEAFSLFAILFVWQFPHFLAIAWMYRDQYTGAGLKMLPGSGHPGIVGAIAAGYAVVLIPVSLLPRQFGFSGDLYVVAALFLGGVYAAASIRFQRNESRQNARSVLLVSLAYLPLLLLALTIDYLRLIH